MTNGEKLKEVFPSIELYEKSHDAIQINFDSVWWNAEYKEPTTKNDLALIHTEGLDEGIRCAMCTNSIKSDRGCDGSCAVNNAMYKEVMDVIENHIADTDKMIEPTTKNDLVVDCVSRKAVINQIFYSTDNNGDVVLGSALRERIARLPSITPQEPKTGHWIDKQHLLSMCSAECSECKKRASGYIVDNGFSLEYKFYDYCPNCGADMREVKE